jgi:NAD/NADP transhydrogenase beta subunit
MGALIAGLFTGASGASLISSIIGALFNSLFSNLFGYLDKQAEGQAREELGRTKEIAKVNKETANAQRKAAEVAINAPDVDEFIDLLEHGTSTF